MEDWRKHRLINPFPLLLLLLLLPLHSPRAPTTCSGKARRQGGLRAQLCFTPPALQTHFSFHSSASAICSLLYICCGWTAFPDSCWNLTALKVFNCRLVSCLYVTYYVLCSNLHHVLPKSAHAPNFRPSSKQGICKYFVWRLPFGTFAVASNYLVAARAIHLHLCSSFYCAFHHFLEQILWSYIFASWVLISQTKVCFSACAVLLRSWKSSVMILSLMTKLRMTLQFRNTREQDLSWIG